jgi:hypothetical protein
MDRSNNTVPAIYGYTVCLIAVLLFVAASVGFVDGVFRTVNPGFEGSHHRMSVPWSRPHGFQVTVPSVARTGSAPDLMGVRRNTFRGAMIARARLNAVRGLVVSLVLLIISIALWRGHWRWLNAPRASLTAINAGESD